MSDEGPKSGDIVGFAAKALVAIALVAWLMYYTWNFVGPSGQAIDFGGFVALWFRELLILGLVGIILIFVCIGWLFRQIRNLFHRGDDAL